MSHTTEQTVYVGIDVAKDKLDVFFSHTKNHRQVKNAETGFEEIFNELPSDRHVLVVTESTGGYEKPVARYLAHQGIAVSIQNPRLIRNHAKSLGLLAKTDKIDARVIADFAQKKEIQRFYVNDEDQEYLQMLVRRRKDLVEILKAEKNRIKQMTQTTIVESIKRTIAHVESEIKQLEDEMDDFIAGHESYHEKNQLLCSVPGIGKTTASILLAEAPELGICNQKEIAMLAGLAPINCDSGNMRGTRMIWGGRKEMRNALYMAALTAIRYNTTIRTFAIRLRQKGKKGKVIVVACMRKLLIILNMMIRNHTYWLERKETTSPITAVS